MSLEAAFVESLMVKALLLRRKQAENSRLGVRGFAAKVCWPRSGQTYIPIEAAGKGLFLPNVQLLYVAEL